LVQDAQVLCFQDFSVPGGKQGPGGAGNPGGLVLCKAKCNIFLYNGRKIFGDTEIPPGRVPGIPSGSRRRGGKGGTDVFRDIAIPRRGIYNGKKFKPV
ncbi:hypothetical protein, partial [uncultured Oscillibacter sp.]|uniref:hypothetical protein n=1 Tax=uncultured Oscillibacter sp. TaxID=876091 RepID=UPI00261AE419